MIEQLMGIREASFEQLDSVGAMHGPRAKAFVLGLIYMQQIVAQFGEMHQYALAGGMSEEESKAKSIVLSSLLSSLTLVMSEGMDIEQEKLDEMFGWMETIYKGAQQRIESLCNDKE